MAAVKNVFSAVEIAMMICGVFPGRGTGAGRYLSWVHTAVVLPACLLGAARMISVYRGLGTAKFPSLTYTFYLICCLWYVLGLSNAIILIFSNWRGWITRYMDGFQEELERNYTIMTTNSANKIRKMATIYTVIIFVAAIFNSGVVIFLANTSEVFDTIFHYPVYNYPYSGVMKAFLYVITLQMSMIWLIPVLLNFAMIRPLSTLFIEHCNTSKAALKRPTLEAVEKSRKDYNELCRLAGDLDRVHGPLNAVNYSVNLGCVLLLLYSFVAGSGSGGEEEVVSAWQLVVFTWIAMSFIYLSVPSILGTQLNCKAHAVKDVLYEADYSTDDVRSFISQASIYLTQVVSEKVGVSILHLFILDKESIVTIGGIVITYFVLIVQFGESAPREEEKAEIMK